LSPEEIASRTLEDRTTRWAEKLSGDDLVVSVVEENGEVVGFASYGASRDEDARKGVVGEVGGLYLV
jgi:L-amino acid N-acyltransferase YncA